MAQETIQFIGISPSELKKELSNDLKTVLLEFKKELINQEKTEVLLTRKQVADLIGGVSVGTIINWSKKGTLIEYGIGRLIRYKKSEVLNSLIKLNA
jgi:hypothetical protein